MKYISLTLPIDHPPFIFTYDDVRELYSQRVFAESNNFGVTSRVILASAREDFDDYSHNPAKLLSVLQSYVRWGELVNLIDPIGNIATAENMRYAMAYHHDGHLVTLTIEENEG